MTWGWLHGFSESHCSLVKYREIVSAWWDAVRTQLEYFGAVQTLAMPSWQLWNVLGGGEEHLSPMCVGISAWGWPMGGSFPPPPHPQCACFPTKELRDRWPYMGKPCLSPHRMTVRVRLLSFSLRTPESHKIATTVQNTALIHPIY